ncbi:MAG: protein translocase subunit SecF [Alphaproteobacteria bacterium]|nr:protein translocase subunit SecF [Alphaproteobacteria bacterium]
MFTGVDFWPHKKIFPIMEVRRTFVTITVGLFVASVVLLAVHGLNFGIDFKGGSLFEIQAKAQPDGKPGVLDIGELREKVGALGLGDVQIQQLDQTSDALIRVEQQKPKEGENPERAQQAAAEKVQNALGEEIEIRRTEVVGSAVSGELKWAGIMAVTFAMVGILFYIWFRFEWQFAVAAIIATVHDITITLGVFSLLNLDFGLSEVAALLTLAGYSINDTVVVFDRIRENLRRYKKMALDQLMNVSINETMSRTVLTSGTTLVAVLAIYVFGTEVIKGFAFAMLFGIIIGTWSSIFVASPFLLWIGVKRDWSGIAKSDKATAAAAAKA